MLMCLITRYIHYGSGPKRFPIQDVLQCALEFAQHGPVNSRSLADYAAELLLADASTASTSTPTAGIMDADMESPRSLNRLDERKLNDSQIII